jgi:sterol desaturase/sphingolipid hydroxylase (fatty acid hydroxylase superfamily)
LIFWLEGIFPYSQPRSRRLLHAADNIAIAAVDALVSLVFLLVAAPFVIRGATVHSFGLGNLLVEMPVVSSLAIFVFFDLWMYLWHRVNHRVAILWRLHRAHHNDICMDSTTALRFHPFEILISSFLNMGVVALLGMDLKHLIVYNAVLQVVILFHHSNIALPERWDRWLRAFIVTPHVHRLHHSIEYSDTNSNYSSIFSFWDRLFLTFRKKEHTPAIAYGLTILREEKWQRFFGFLKIPFQDAG